MLRYFCPLASRGCAANDERVNPLVWEEPGDKSKKAILYNAAEILVLGNQSSFISWQSLGPPSSTDLMSTFHILLQAGAKLGLPALLMLRQWAHPTTPHTAEEQKISGGQGRAGHCILWDRLPHATRSRKMNRNGAGTGPLRIKKVD